MIGSKQTDIEKAINNKIIRENNKNAHFHNGSLQTDKMQMCQMMPEATVPNFYDSVIMKAVKFNQSNNLLKLRTIWK